MLTVSVGVGRNPRHIPSSGIPRESVFPVLNADGVRLCCFSPARSAISKSNITKHIRCRMGSLRRSESVRCTHVPVDSSQYAHTFLACGVMFCPFSLPRSCPPWQRTRVLVSGCHDQRVVSSIPVSDRYRACGLPTSPRERDGV